LTSLFCLSGPDHSGPKTPPDPVLAVGVWSRKQGAGVKKGPGRVEGKKGEKPRVLPFMGEYNKNCLKEGKNTGLEGQKKRLK